MDEIHLPSPARIPDLPIEIWERIIDTFIDADQHRTGSQLFMSSAIRTCLRSCISYAAPGSFDAASILHRRSAFIHGIRSSPLQLSSVLRHRTQLVYEHSRYVAEVQISSGYPSYPSVSPNFPISFVSSSPRSVLTANIFAFIKSTVLLPPSRSANRGHSGRYCVESMGILTLSVTEDEDPSEVGLRIDIKDAGDNTLAYLSNILLCLRPCRLEFIGIIVKTGWSASTKAWRSIDVVLCDVGRSTGVLDVRVLIREDVDTPAWKTLPYECTDELCREMLPRCFAVGFLVRCGGECCKLHNPRE